jgi:hypothetical protein
MKKYLVYAVLALVVGSVGYSVVTKIQNERAGAAQLEAANDPKQIAWDECMAAAAGEVQRVFLEFCSTNRAIEKDGADCGRWSSAAMFEFMNKSSSYPAFKEALAAWEQKAVECSTPQ